MSSISFSPGSLVTRAVRQRLYGGGIQRGIEASTTTPNVFVYSDPGEGQKYGYSFDGWVTDGSIFFYTGEGARGDQQLTSGNRAILQHRRDGRSLHLFVVDGGRQRGGKLHRYIGEFEVDDNPPFIREDARDADDEMRSVIVFRLRPIGSVFRDDDQASGLADASAKPQSELVDIEGHFTFEFEQSPTAGGTATRMEAELSNRYRTYLKELGHDIRRYRIRPPGEVGSLYTDLYDVTMGDLYEAKGTVTREAIRTAIGQLLDYRRHIHEHQSGKEVVLLPTLPAPDLVELIHSCGMSCVYEAKGDFIRLEPGSGHFRHQSEQ
jgi:hypothetical protein